MATPTDPYPPERASGQMRETPAHWGVLAVIVAASFLAGWVAHDLYSHHYQPRQEAAQPATGPVPGVEPSRARATPPKDSVARPAPAVPTPEGILKQFDEDQAMQHVRMLAVDIGKRYGGTAGERKAADYIAATLAEYGYDVVRQEGIPLPPVSRETQNVIAIKPGEGEWGENVIVVGGHMDSIDRGGGSPGANDNASGVGVILEMARVLATYQLPYTVHFVAFGAEEMVDRTFEHHHYGSRHYCKLYRSGKHPGGRVIGMLSVDMIGVGDALHLINMREAPMDLYEICQRSADAMGVSIVKSADHRGCSDHEPFEGIGVPSAWFERKEDPDYHTARDSYGNVERNHLKLMGKYALHVLLHIDGEDLRTLAGLAPPAPHAAKSGQ